MIEPRRYRAMVEAGTVRKTYWRIDSRFRFTDHYLDHEEEAAWVDAWGCRYRWSDIQNPRLIFAGVKDR